MGRRYTWCTWAPCRHEPPLASFGRDTSVSSARCSRGTGQLFLSETIVKAYLHITEYSYAQLFSANIDYLPDNCMDLRCDSPISQYSHLSIMTLVEHRTR